MSEYTQKINEQFIQEIENYKQSPVPACNEKTALKLLAEYRRDSIKFARKFWPDPVAKYLPAVSQGTMFLAQENYPHNEALKIAIERADALCYKDIANAFIFGVSRGIPAYRAILPAYLHIKAIPPHGEEFIDHPDKPHARCTCCSYKSVSPEQKMSFFWINSMQCHRIFCGGFLGGPCLNTSSFILRESAKMPTVKATKDDYKVFVESLKLTEQLLPEQKISSYSTLLKESKIIPIKTNELQKYLDILGYLDILHTDEYHGITKKFIRRIDMPDAVESRSNYDFPVHSWRAKNGVDWERVSELFEDYIV